MLLKAYNRSLIRDREKTSLTVASAAASTTITVTGVDSNAWADDDFIIIGEIGSPTTEIMQINGAVSDGTSLTIDRSGSGSTRFAHSIGEPVYRIDYNQVVFYNNSTNTTSGATTLTTIEVQADDEFTRYEDTANTTGYGFIRFKNSASGAFSSYSDGVNYEASGEGSSTDPRTLFVLRKKTRQLLDENSPTSKLTDEMIDSALNDKQKEIAHMRLWSFYEGERSFALVANQFAYTLPITVQMVHGVKVDTEPIPFISKAEWDIRNWDMDNSQTTPSAHTIWNREIWFTPRPSTASSTTTLSANISSATATSISVASTANFNRGDYYRFVVNSEVIYATAATSTTFTGCLRGQEGTTATTHTSGDTVTERDIVYSCHVDPSDLIDTQDRTAIPEPDILVYGAAIDLAPFVQKESLIPAWEVKYARRIEELKAKYSSKQTMQFGRIKNMNERIPTGNYVNPNDFPQSIG